MNNRLTKEIFKMGKLYFAQVTVEAEMTVPVEADSKDEAALIAKDSCDIHDFDFDTFSYAKEADKCPDWARNEIVEGSDGKTCAELFGGEDCTEQRMREMEESWPKLPGFSDPVTA